MKKGTIIVAGGYFSDPRIKLFDHALYKPKQFDWVDLKWEDVYHNRKIKIPNNDYVFIFGMKTITRRLRKKRLPPKKIMPILERFFVSNISKKVPLGVLDDFNGGDEKTYGDGLRKLFISKFNCKVFLLREYLTNKKYHKLVKPFSIPCVNHSEYVVPIDKRTRDIYFKGNVSSNDRKPIVQAVSKMPFRKTLSLYTGGERSGKKDSFSTYLKNMATSNVCLHFQGAGYCCFRYQEIPSVGSLIATPKYPFVVRHDYKDMHSCIKYSNPKELKNKLDRVLGSKDLLSEMTVKSYQNFLENHTNIARYNQFVEELSVL